MYLSRSWKEVNGTLKRKAYEVKIFRRGGKVKEISREWD